jgi:hypothetical protein
MRAGLLIVSLIGFVAAAYFLMQDLVPEFEDVNELIYVILLVLLLCNSFVGIIIAFPDSPGLLKKVKLLRRNNTLKKEM